MEDKQPRAIHIAHSSDLHLGWDVRGSDDFERALHPLRQVLPVARDVAADLLLLVGDVFDHNRVPTAFVERAAQLLAEATQQVVILPGNHDPLTPDSVYRRGGLADLPHVHVVGLTADDAIAFPDLELEVWGRAHHDYVDMSPLRDPRPRSTRWQVVLAHGHVVEARATNGQFLGSWLITLDELDATGADYVALGHWNRNASVGRDVAAHYSGSPDLAGTLNLAHFGANGEVRVERIKLPPAT